jgi:predicted Zn-dependent protease
VTRALVLFALLLMAGVAVYLSERQPAQPPVDPAPLANLVGDAGRTLGRVPAAAVRISDEEEIAAGTQLARAIAQAMEPPPGQLQAYVERVGAKVSAQARRRLPWAFHVDASLASVNAFALPGGHIFVGLGLMALMTTEDALAAVLAHEVEHVDHYHCADRYSAERARRGSVIGAIVQLPIDLFQAGYSKTQEQEADLEGVRLAAAAGYAPLAVVELFDAMARAARQGDSPRQRAGSPVEEAIRIPADAIDAYFRSHPPVAERITRIRDVVRQERLGAGRAAAPIDPSVAASARRLRRGG